MNDQDITLVRHVRPVVPPDDPAVRARALARLRAEFDTPARTRTLRRRVAWRVAVAGAVAVGATTAVIVVRAGGSAPSRPLPGGGSTAQTLELAARTIERERVPRPRPDQWVYAPELRNWAIAPGNTIGTLRGKVKVEQWWRFDGGEIATSTQGSPLQMQQVLRPGQKLRRGYPGGAVWGPALWENSPRALYGYVARLPTDPDGLLAKVRHDEKDPGHDRRTFGRIGDILDGDKLIPPKTNAALYRALAKIPGVTVVPGVKDLAGRPGIAVSRTSSSQENRIEFILDATTYRYLGTRVTVTKDQYDHGKVWEHAGQIVNDTADLDSRVVDRPGQR
ncbi:CU044_5270 family protein [Actinomadura sp. DC4]|uniref:CU044_5270 family protein n=1 Tax=Actinomadura sp. DC4 TaxID=3055069 RepID=UPI0025B27B5C|nr:CU044_5270 family protein [Actinomadura sp. DC4]MDN3355559.1 CU044_5270 family protein [Actinomadura sp. DC4]